MGNKQDIPYHQPEKYHEHRDRKSSHQRRSHPEDSHEHRGRKSSHQHRKVIDHSDYGGYEEIDHRRHPRKSSSKKILKSSRYYRNQKNEVSRNRSSSEYYYKAAKKDKCHEKVQSCQDSTKQRRLAEEKIKDKYIGVDNVLIIQKEGKSYFHCYLCDICTEYNDSKQLTDHVLGDYHQRAYKEQKGKDFIKIKKLKIRNPFEESIEEMPISNKKETAKTKVETFTLRNHSDSLTHGYKIGLTSDPKYNLSSTIKSSKKKLLLSGVLKRTIESAEQYNQRYDQKKAAAAFPEKRLQVRKPESLHYPYLSTTLHSTLHEMTELLKVMDTLTGDNLLTFCLWKMDNIKMSKEHPLLLGMASDNLCGLVKEIISSKESSFENLVTSTNKSKVPIIPDSVLCNLPSLQELEDCRRIFNELERKEEKIIAVE